MNKGIRFGCFLFLSCLLACSSQSDEAQEKTTEDDLALLSAVGPNQVPPTNHFGWGPACEWTSILSGSFQEGLFLDGEGSYVVGYVWKTISSNTYVTQGLIAKIDPQSLSMTPETTPDVAAWTSVDINPKTEQPTATADGAPLNDQADKEYGFYQRDNAGQWSLVFQGIGRSVDHCYASDENLYLAVHGHNGGNSFETTILVIDPTTFTPIKTYSPLQIYSRRIRCLEQGIYLVGHSTDPLHLGGALAKITNQGLISFPPNSVFVKYHDVAPAKTGKSVLVIGTLPGATPKAAIIPYNLAAGSKTVYPHLSGRLSLFRDDDGVLYGMADGHTPNGYAQGFSAYFHPQGTSWQAVLSNFEHNAIWEKDDLIFAAGTKIVTPPYGTMRGIPGLSMCAKTTTQTHL